MDRPHVSSLPLGLHWPSPGHGEVGPLRSYGREGRGPLILQGGALKHAQSCFTGHLLTLPIERWGL